MNLWFGGEVQMKRKFISVLLVLVMLVSGASGVLAADLESGMPPAAVPKNNYEPSPNTKFKMGKLSEPLKDQASIISFALSQSKSNALKGIKPAYSFKIEKSKYDEAGRQHVVLQQTQNGVPIYGHYYQVSLDGNQQVYAVQDKSELDLSAVQTTKPSITGEQATNRLKSALEAFYGQPVELESDYKLFKYPKPTAELLIYPYEGKTYLAYEVQMSFLKPAHGNWIGYVDATTGEVIEKYNKIQNATAASGTGYGYNGAAKTINITRDEGYYFLFDQSHSGAIVSSSYNYDVDDEGYIYASWSRSSTFKDSGSLRRYRDVVDAHYNADIVYDYYLNTFGRNSVDGNGARILSIANLPDEDGYPLDNAAWDDSLNAMFYGDGSGVRNGGMNCTACSLDIVAHEITHGVTSHTADLEYRYQSGALNESISDIMASVIDSADWTIGEDTGMIGRSMQNPNLYDQPKTMSEYEYLTIDQDNGGVHVNSGIPNYAAYLMATKINSLGLNGKTILGKLTYNALSYHLTATSDFVDAKNSYLLAAGEISSLTEQQRKAVRLKIIDAWGEVGIPTVVADFSVTGHTPASVTFSWTAGSGASNVIIQQSADNGANWTTASTGVISTSAATATASNLLPATNYLFRLVINGGNSAGTSNLAAWTTEARTISDFAIKEKGSRFALFTWSKAIGATKVKIHKSENEGQTWEFVELPVESTQVMDAGLIPNKNYRFYLSVTGGGYQGKSNEVRFTTNAEPLVLNLVEAVAGSAKFQWEAPKGATGIVLQQTTNGTTWTTANTGALGLSAAGATVTGLQAATSYKFRLSVSGGQNNGFSNEKSITTASFPIETLAVSGKTTSTASLAWPALLKPTSLIVQQKTEGTGWTIAKTGTLSTSSKSATVSGLAANTAYQFRLVVTGGGNAGESNIVDAKTDAVKITSFAKNGNATVSAVPFKWTAALGATSVAIEQSTDGATWTLSATGSLAANASAATVSGLRPNKTYQFRLKVTGGQNEGSSNSVSATTVAAPLTDLASGEITGSTAELNWTAAVGASSVKAELSSNGGSSWTAAMVETAVGANASTAKVTGLLAGTDYKLRLNVTSGENNGLSNVISIKTAIVPVSTLTSSGKTTSSITLSWPALVKPTSLIVQQKTEGTGWTTAKTGTLSTSAKGATVSGLTANTAYQFRLVVTGGGNAGESNIVDAKTDAIKITSFAKNGNATVSSASFKWTAAIGATGIAIEQSTDGATWTLSDTGSLAANTSAATVNGLRPNKTYQFRLKVTGGQNEGSSNSVSATTVAAPLTSLVSGEVTGSTVELVWTAAVGASSVKAELSSNGGSSWAAATVETAVSANGTTAKVTGLLAGTDYKLRLNVTSGENNGLSNVISIKTVIVPVSTLTSSGKTTSSITLSWPALVKPTSLIVQQKTEGTGWTTAKTGTLSTTSAKVATVSGLTANTAYQFRLVVTGGGNAGESNIVDAKTDAIKITSFAKNGNATVSTASFKWTAAIGATGIAIEQSTDGATWTLSDTGSLAANGSAATVTGLRPNKMYQFRLKVTGGQNEGPRTA
ncbi:hypothetical protein D3H35_14815 [Cohnella faecalis]|uniref:Fibronectin type-III domain-containing protein n=2 Tax=Cohnella faecalis TaxID=2315694 RepID=A0A398CH10_9BACL|nr:hypothetical protein D3H35_14815 [Cohnella faecalis]